MVDVFPFNVCSSRCFENSISFEISTTMDNGGIQLLPCSQIRTYDASCMVEFQKDGDAQCDRRASFYNGQITKIACRHPVIISITKDNSAITR